LLIGLIGHSILLQHFQELLLKASRTWANRVIKEVMPCDGGFTFTWYTTTALPSKQPASALASQIFAKGSVATGMEFIALDDTDIDEDLHEEEMHHNASEYESPSRLPLILRHEMLFDSYSTLARL
jgi:hypothetical protein